jgi:hypothetical protein
MGVSRVLVTPYYSGFAVWAPRYDTQAQATPVQSPHVFLRELLHENVISSAVSLLSNIQNFHKIMSVFYLNMY